MQVKDTDALYKDIIVVIMSEVCNLFITFFYFEENESSILNLESYPILFFWPFYKEQTVILVKVPICNRLKIS